ncbi:hypothetical protein, partial [Gordonia sp. N1V]|uniref:hypothetical protein n=1 Tax=Gordonia sp. N1V TaxID=3034163 RepID=UPI0023E161E6
MRSTIGGPPQIANTFFNSSINRSAVIERSTMFEVPQFEWTPEIVGLWALLEGCHYVEDASVVYA